MSIGTGRATIFGFPGGITWTGIGAGTFFKQSGEFSDEFEKIQVKDDSGKTRLLVACDKLFMGKINWTPVAIVGTNTVANAATMLEPPPEIIQVTLSLFTWATANALKWGYWGGWKIGPTNGGITSYDFSIMASDDPTIDLFANRLVYT